MQYCRVEWFIHVETEAAPWVSNVPSPSVLPWKKSNCVSGKAKRKASIQNYCFILKLSSLEPMPSGHVLPSEREKESFFVPLGLY